MRKSCQTLSFKKLLKYYLKKSFKNLYAHVHSSTIYNHRKGGNNPNRQNENWSIHIMEYYLPIKRNEVLLHATT